MRDEVSCLRHNYVVSSEYSEMNCIYHDHAHCTPTDAVPVTDILSMKGKQNCGRDQVLKDDG